MRYKKKTTVRLGLILLACLVFQTSAWSQSDENLFREAKVFLFDKKWVKAQEKLEELLSKYPDSPLFSQALFYKGRCLEEQDGQEREAVEVYERYTLRRDRTASLAEEAEVSIIDLAYKLYGRGKKSALDKIETRLYRQSRVVKYYAAVKLSYVKDKKRANKAVPVLKEILKAEKDEELRDRAKIALLRIDPKSLQDFEEQRYERKARVFHLRVQNRGKKEPEVAINIPWALADLALSSIPEKERQEMREEGYDIDKIIRELTEYQGKIVEIKTKTSIIKIWID